MSTGAAADPHAAPAEVPAGPDGDAGWAAATRMDADGTVTRHFGGVGFSNGIGISPGGDRGAGKDAHGLARTDPAASVCSARRWYPATSRPRRKTPMIISMGGTAMPSGLPESTSTTPSTVPAAPIYLRRS